MCPLTLHTLLHLADDIERNGPLSMNWSFVMEHWCGQLVPAIKSRVYPYKSLTRQQHAIAQENSILAQYNLFNIVHGPMIDPDEPRHREEILDEGMYLFNIVYASTS